MKIKKIKFSKLTLVLIIVSILSPLNTFAQAKTKAKDKRVEVTLKVVNEENEIIQGASVVIGEGLIHAVTDVNGEFVFKAKPSTAVSVSMIGYEKYSSFVAPLVNDGTIILKTAEFLKSSDDVVNIPFSTTFKRYSTDNLSVLNSEDLSKYPTSDLRNAMVGLLPGYMSTEKDGQPGLQAEEMTGKYGAKTKVDEIVRGQSVVYVIDDIQVDISEMPLDPEEIESVTLVKDPVTKSLYGPAAQSIIYIKTKRGKINERKISANVEAGISVVDRFPEFTNGVEYAKLNNIARENSGLTPLYTDEAINEYSKNNPYSILYPNTDYRNMILKNTRSYQRVNVSSLGGNQKVQYAAYIGYTGEGDIYKIGRQADYNRLNVRTNLDVKLNDIMKIRFDFSGNLSVRRSPNYNSEEKNNEFSALISDVNYTSPIAFPISVGVSEVTGRPNYGISKTFTYNPIGGMEGSGFYNEMNRSGIGNISLDIDFSHLVKGLKSTSYIGFNGAYLTRIGKKEQYAAYYVIPDQEAEEGYTLEKVRNEEIASGKSKLHDYYNLRYTAFERLSYDRTFGKHYVKSGLTMLLSQLTRDGYKEPIRQANGIFDASYIYNNKYIFQGVVNYVGSSYYAKSNRYKIFPTFGAAWIVSDEKFMKKCDVIDYLKVRTQIGRIGAVTYKTNYKYESDWSNADEASFGYPGGSASSWFGNNTSSSSSTTYSTLGNRNLDWEYWDEFTVGTELMLFKQRLSLDISYYNRTKNGIISQVSNYFPSYMGFHTLPYENYGKSRYTGIETLISFKDNIGDFNYRIGVNLTHSKGTSLIVDEPNYPDNEKWYRSKVGKSTGGIYGLICTGKYTSDEEAINDPIKSSFSTDLKKGDLIYKDMNGDGVINNNDITRIGESSPKLYYALNLNFSYKGIELTAVGTGQAGCEGLLPSSYYRSGSGDNNYSAWVRDNIGGEYPRLTYYKVEHNFQNSTFWLRNTSYFKLQNVELAYNIPAKICNQIGLGGIRIFARGANLFTISGIKYTDPESMESGINVYPLYTTYVGGIKLTF